MALPEDQIDLIRHFARVLRQHVAVFRPDELELAASAIEQQAELALATLDELSVEAGAGDLRGMPHALSAREIEVLDLVSDGLPDKQIAQRLGISTFTVNKHVGAILTKMRASSRTEASVRATQEGFLPAKSGSHATLRA
jgi:DNA-binding NarL/FixJ family response regulator